MKISQRRLQRVENLKKWAAKVVKLRRGKKKDDWKNKLILHAVECNQPFLYKPKVPPYPFEKLKAQVLKEDDCPLVDVNDAIHEEISIKDVKKGDVVRIDEFYALVRLNMKDKMQIQLAYSYIEQSDRPDYGIRWLKHEDIGEIELLKQGHEILQLTHFDVQV